MSEKKEFISLEEVEKWFIVTLIGDRFQEIEPSYDGSLEIEITINGIQFDLSEVIKSLDNGFEEMAKRVAVDLLTEEMTDVTNNLKSQLYHIEQQIEQLRNNFMKEVGF